MPHHSKARVLALEIRSRSLAYAIFDEPTQLVDFGSAGSPHNEFHADRVEKLARRFAPEVIVLRKIILGSIRDTPLLRAAHSSVRSRARHFHIPLSSIDRGPFARLVRNRRPTRLVTAQLLAVCFPSLAWYVPGKRKSYRPEDKRMKYFDAVGIGLAYYAAQGHAEAIGRMLTEADAPSETG